MSIKRKVSETHDTWLRIPSSDKANHMAPYLHDQMFLTNPRGIFTLESLPRGSYREIKFAVCARMFLQNVSGIKWLSTAYLTSLGGTVAFKK